MKPGSRGVPKRMSKTSTFRLSGGSPADVIRHNAICEGKVALLDFLDHNAVTDEKLQNGGSANYLDLVHFCPPVGVRLLRRMLGASKEDASLGIALADPALR